YRETRGDWLLLVNQDAFLAPDFLERALAAARAAAAAGVKVGAVQGLVLRTTPAEGSAPAAPRAIDALGVELRRSRRNLILGHGLPESAARGGEVFAPDGAVSLFRRAALEDAAVDGLPYDPAFFFGRDEVDLGWRTSRLGWRTLVEPAARAFHCRTLSRATARTVPLAIRRASVRARYLLFAKHERARDLLRDLPWVLGFELAYAAYQLVRDPRAYLGGVLGALRLLPAALRARRAFFARRPPFPDAPRRFFGARLPLPLAVAGTPGNP
ncbi:MAG TPA: glycosyltransferase, partial [Planctomycetota bacterium]|nr:glycosyltransferase [Planctomycetota bacterium]